MIITEGIVIKERSVGEQDKFIDILTKEYGVVEAAVKGARKINGKSGSSTQLFAYSRFCLQLRKERYYLNSAEPICIFYNLRTGLKKLSLASYFAEVVNYSIERQSDNGEILRLMLNTLHYLENDLRPLDFLKSLFEIRLCTEIGIMPDIICCCECGAFESDKIIMKINDGNFCCHECCNQLADGSYPEDYILSEKALLHAVRHIVLSDFNKLYNFRVSDNIQSQLSEYAEKYLITHLEHNFKTLDFYKTAAQ